MKRRKYAPTGNRSGNQGRFVVPRRQVEVAPPTAGPGQVSCPSCRNTVATTPFRGDLARHNDLFGDPCPQIRPAAEPIHPATLPPINLGDHRGTTLPVTGHCHDCGDPVSGERRFCGRCAAARS